ncbi:CD276 antigen homolog [Salminus brasiliensis]|uniref:CD276 antigen homolog n=1 Tax=Salminus brasiliensis TaxID=930266 RepID=UPI003B8391DB
MIDKVFLQEIKAVVGDSVILPCSHSDEALKDTVTVFWRYRDSKIVYDIIMGEQWIIEQESAFRDRVESFPDEWRNGNFSIRLSDVRESDEGPYTCFIPALRHQTPLHLRVEEELRSRDVKPSLENLLLFPAALL